MDEFPETIRVETGPPAHGERRQAAPVARGVPVENNAPEEINEFFDELANEAKLHKEDGDEDMPEVLPESTPLVSSMPSSKSMQYEDEGSNSNQMGAPDRGLRAHQRRAGIARIRKARANRQKRMSRKRPREVSRSPSRKRSRTVSRSRSYSSRSRSNSPERASETRIHKIVRIESVLLAMKLKVPDFESLSDRQLDRLDEKLKIQYSRENLLRNMRHAVIIFCNIVEGMHSAYNPKQKYLLEGWGQQTFAAVSRNEYDNYLLQIYDYYSPQMILHPVLAFSLALGGNALMFAFTRYFMQNGLAGMAQAVQTPDFAMNMKNAFDGMRSMPPSQVHQAPQAPLPPQAPHAQQAQPPPSKSSDPRPAPQAPPRGPETPGQAHYEAERRQFNANPMDLLSTVMGNPAIMNVAHMFMGGMGAPDMTSAGAASSAPFASTPAPIEVLQDSPVIGEMEPPLSPAPPLPAEIEEPHNDASEEKKGLRITI